MSDTIFKLNNVDYSAHVVADSYNVNFEDIYNEWKDGGQVTHRDIIMQKLRGTFNMYFADEAELQTFISALGACQTNNAYPAQLKANNQTVSTLVSKNVFIDFKPVRKRDPAWKDVFDIFEVTIEEP